jgi:hypothetical protein
MLIGEIVAVAAPPGSLALVAATALCADEHPVILARLDPESS